jgi:hypothetical protein
MPQSETAKPANITDNQMERGKHKNISKRNQGYLTSSETSSPIRTSPGYPNTLEKQEMQENTGKKVEVLKKETQKSLKESQENTTIQVKELNKAILNTEIETIFKNHKRRQFWR